MSIVKGIALITGSAQGIGRSIALRLARDGFDIALNDVASKREQLRVVAEDIERIGRRTHLVSADVTVEREVKEMVQDVAKRLGGLDVVSRCRTHLMTFGINTFLLDGSERGYRSNYIVGLQYAILASCLRYGLT